jgi:hypothetical protein
MLESRFAQEALPPCLDLLARRRIDHVVVVGGDLVVQTLGRMRQKVAVLVDRAALTGTPFQIAAIAFSSPGAPSTMRNSGRRHAG